MVNGAGLAMATMDIIKLAGGNPANFLDVGGGATQEQIEHAFEILLSDAHVKAIFINIFGGILRVDRLATGVVAAARNLKISIPIVLRLEGTNVEEGRKILKSSGLNFLVGATMKEAAELVVKAASSFLLKGERMSENISLSLLSNERQREENGARLPRTDCLAESYRIDGVHLCADSIFF